MIRVLEISDGIYEIHPELNFMFTLSYVVTGDRTALIDPGSRTQAEIVLRAIQDELGIDPDSITHIIPTHLHIDHAGGVGYVAERLPRARVAVYERHVRHAIDPTTLVAGYKQTFGDNFADTFGSVLPVPESHIMPVSGGERIDLGGRHLEVIYSRGHANHHFCLWDERTRGIFCGDALGMYYPDADGVVIICPEGFELNMAIDTITQLRDRNPQLLYYAHEGTGRQPDELMKRAVQQLHDCGSIILKELREGTKPKDIEARLVEYFTEHVSRQLKYDRMYLDLTVAGYRRYYARSGLIANNGGTN